MTPQLTGIRFVLRGGVQLGFWTHQAQAEAWVQQHAQGAWRLKDVKTLTGRCLHTGALWSVDTSELVAVHTVIAIQDGQQALPGGAGCQSGLN